MGAGPGNTQSPSHYSNLGTWHHSQDASTDDAHVYATAGASTQQPSHGISKNADSHAQPVYAALFATPNNASSGTEYRVALPSATPTYAHLHGIASHTASQETYATPTTAQHRGGAASTTDATYDTLASIISHGSVRVGENGSSGCDNLYAEPTAQSSVNTHQRTMDIRTTYANVTTNGERTGVDRPYDQLQMDADRVEVANYEQGMGMDMC